MAKRSATSPSYRSLALDPESVPDLTVKLSRVYEFNVAGSSDDPTIEMLDAQSVIEVSSLKPTLVRAVDEPVRIALTKGSSIDLPPGVTIIIGKSGVGKTKFAMQRLAGTPGGTYVRFGEPLDQYFRRELQEGRVAYEQFEPALAAQVASFLLSPDDRLLVLDSLRYLIFAGSGATGKGGVNLTLFTDLSFLDNVVALRGKSLVIVLNPMTDDRDSYGNLLEIAAGSVSAVIDVVSEKAVRYSSRYSGRQWTQLAVPLTPAADVQSVGITTQAVASAQLDLTPFTK